MASINIPIVSEFDTKGTQKAIKEFQSLEGASAKASFAIKKAAKPAAAAIAGIGAALALATAAAIDDQKEQSDLALILTNTADASDELVKSIEDEISVMSRASGIADTDYRKALEILTIQSKDAGKSMDDMNLIMDTAVGLHTDSATVADALAKAYEGNFKALKTLSPEIKTMVDDGKSLEEIMAVMGGTFGGAVSKNAETAAGQMAILKNSIGETQESIGAALLPVIEAVLPYLQAFADWAQKNPETFTIIAAAIAGIAAAIVLTNIAMALNPFALIAIGVGLLVAALKIAYDKFEGFRKVVDIVFDALVKGGKLVFDGLTTYFTGLYNAFKTLFNGIAKLWNGTVGKLAFNIPSWVPVIGGKGFEVPEIPMLADGGIVTGPTLAMIGERGPEAVIPLSGRGGGMGNYTININGGLGSSAEIGTAVVNAIRAFNRQNGPANIAVA
jgi:hypothetical protein